MMSGCLGTTKKLQNDYIEININCGETGDQEDGSARYTKPQPQLINKSHLALKTQSLLHNLELFKRPLSSECHPLITKDK